MAGFTIYFYFCENKLNTMFHYNLYPMKICAGLISSAFAVFSEKLLPLFITVIVFEAIDFFTGVLKSAVVSKRKGEKPAFESVKAWRTIYKFVFILIGICLSEMLDHTLVEANLRLSNYFTAFCCGVEFWSFLENAAIISDHPVFRWLRKYMKVKLEDEIGIKAEEQSSNN